MQVAHHCEFASAEGWLVNALNHPCLKPACCTALAATSGSGRSIVQS